MQWKDISVAEVQSWLARERSIASASKPGSNVVELTATGLSLIEYRVKVGGGTITKTNDLEYAVREYNRIGWQNFR